MTREQMSADRVSLAKRLRDVVGNTMGDDLERATWAFGKLSDEQLDQQHGQSGNTRREIWDGYKKHREDDERLLAFVDELLMGASL